MFEVPFILLTIIRSSNTLIFTLVSKASARFMSSPVDLRRSDYLKAVLITLGVVLFTIGKSKGGSDKEIKLTSLTACLLSMIMEAFGAILLQCLKRKYQAEDLNDLTAASTVHTMILSSVHGKVL